MRRAGPLLLLTGLALACGKDRGDEKAKQRLWGREAVPTEVERLSQEALDPARLAEDAKTRARVLSMGMDELYARFGFLKYEGTASLELSRGDQSMSVTERSVIEHGLHGDFRVVQTGPEDKPLRALVYHGGILFIQNGGGEFRVQGIVNHQHKAARDEAFEPLRVYTAYYGERLGLRSKGGGSHGGRTVHKYELRLAPGPDLVGEGTKDGPKRPVSLEGELWVDAETAAPVKCRLAGVLEIPGKKDEGAPPAATLTLGLDMSLVSVPGQELKPEKFIPTIRRHPTDLEPLAFLEGETKTSTVIGGAKAPPTPAAKPEAAKPEAAKPEAAKPEATKPGKKKKKKKDR